MKGNWDARTCSSIRFIGVIIRGDDASSDTRYMRLFTWVLVFALSITKPVEAF
jgi:hypothetical protein